MIFKEIGETLLGILATVCILGGLLVGAGACVYYAIKIGGSAYCLLLLAILALGLWFMALDEFMQIVKLTKEAKQK